MQAPSNMEESRINVKSQALRDSAEKNRTVSMSRKRMAVTETVDLVEKHD